MLNFLNNKRQRNIFLGALLAIVFLQSFFLIKLYSEKDDKNYEVNLVKINTERDSIDYLKMQNDLKNIDDVVDNLNGFLRSKSITNEKIISLSEDSISNTVYLAKVSNRYSQYLVDLQEKLQNVPLGMPSEGYISSNFGKRKNPIPMRSASIMMASVSKPTPTPSPVVTPVVVEEKGEPKKVLVRDSTGAIKEVTIYTYSKPKAVIKSASVATNNSPASVTSTKTSKPVEQNNAPAEADQIQFHKGLDIAVAYGSDVRASATGTVIFSGQKGGYGNCVIISHGNGLATLYAHLSELLVKTNQHVKVNDVIAKSGNSGRSTGPHLHYEVHKNNTPVNPKLFMNF